MCGLRSYLSILVSTTSWLSSIKADGYFRGAYHKSLCPVDMNPAPCSYCQTTGHLPLVTLPCCHAEVHAVCINWLMDFHSKECIECKAPLPKEFVSMVRIRAKHTETCPICLEDMVCEEQYMSCGHWIHHQCIRQYINVKEECPICRTRLTDFDILKIKFDQHQCVCRQMRNFLETPEFRSLNRGMRTAIKSCILNDFFAPAPHIPDLEWSPEQVLKKFELLYNDADFMTIGFRVGIRSALRQFHTCLERCRQVGCEYFDPEIEVVELLE